MNNLIGLFCVFFLFSCATASTDFEGFTDPDYRNGFKAKDIIVISEDLSLSNQKLLINRLKSSFSDYDIDVIGGIDIFPPTREYTSEEKNKIIQGTGADAILYIKVESIDYSTRHVPVQYHEGEKESYVVKSGDTAKITTKDTSYTSGGYSVSKPWMDYDVTLKDAKNGKTIWIAEGYTGGNAFASYTTLIKDLAKELPDDLYNSGLLSGNISD